MAGTRSLLENDGRRALLVIDLQNDFCRGGALAVPGGEDIIPLVNELLKAFPISVLTQDWHPKGHCSFAPPFKDIRDSIAGGGGTEGSWPEHCVAGTWGADFPLGLESWRARLILRKGSRPDLDSYSAFLENDRISTTGLAGWLKELGVSFIYVAGLATDYCVRASVLDGLALGFGVCLVSDAVRAVDASPGDGDRAIGELAARGCIIRRSEEIL